MAQDLSKNIVYYDKIYDKSGLIVINKPAGVPLKSSKDAIGLEDCLPDLSQILGVEKITVVKTVHRFASGCVLLSSKEKKFNQIKRAVNRSGIHDQGFNKCFYAITETVIQRQLLGSNLSRKQITYDTKLR